MKAGQMIGTKKRKMDMTSGKTTYTFEALIEFVVSADSEQEAREKLVCEKWDHWLVDDSNSPSVLAAFKLLSERINTCC